MPLSIHQFRQEYTDSCSTVEDHDQLISSVQACQSFDLHNVLAQLLSPLYFQFCDVHTKVIGTIYSLHSSPIAPTVAVKVLAAVITSTWPNTKAFRDIYCVSSG